MARPAVRKESSPRISIKVGKHAKRLRSIDMDSAAQVSIALVTYNHERYITRAVDSVLMQETEFPFEIVIGEDCSTDGTRRVVQALQEKHPSTIRLLLHERNCGPYNNVRKTLGLCQGRYIAFLDGDDYWSSPRKLQRQVEYLDAHPECSMCFHGVEVKDEDGDLADYKPKREKKKLFYDVEDLIESNQIPASSVMYRRDIMNQYCWKNEEVPPNGDTVFYIWNAQFGSIGYIDELMGVRQLHGEALYSSLDRIEKLLWRIETNKFMDTKLNARYRGKLRRQRAKLYVGIASAYARIGEQEKGRECLKKGITSSLYGRRILTKKLVATFLRLYAPKIRKVLLTLR